MFNSETYVSVSALSRCVAGEFHTRRSMDRSCSLFEDAVAGFALRAFGALTLFKYSGLEPVKIEAPRHSA